MVKNPSANARDTGLIPSPGRFHIPRRNETHTPQLLSPNTTTTEAPEPACCSYYVCASTHAESLCYTRDASSVRPVHHKEEWPLLAKTAERPFAPTKTQHGQK